MGQVHVKSNAFNVNNIIYKFAIVKTNLLLTLRAKFEKNYIQFAFNKNKSHKVYAG